MDCTAANTADKAARRQRRRVAGLPADDERHGTVNGYINLCCRCQPCRDAWAADFARAREQRRAKADAGAPEIVHGRYTTYFNWGCRCDACREAHNAYERARYAKRKSA